MNDYFIDVPLMIVKNQLKAEEKLKDYSVLQHLPNEDFCRPYLVLWGIYIVWILQRVYAR